MAYDLKNVTVLIVDDNHPMLSLLQAMLIQFGVGRVVTADNGETAFQKFCHHRPDIVISDWMMEPEDGVYLAQKIRTDPASPNPYTPFIIMTGFSEEYRVVGARDVGITEFLLKPFSAIDLYKRLVTIIEMPRQFVKSDDFFGPDRRRRKDTHYAGGDKRKDDRKGLSEKEYKKKLQADAQKRIDASIEKQGVSSVDDVMLEDENVEEVDLVDRT